MRNLLLILTTFLMLGCVGNYENSEEGEMKEFNFDTNRMYYDRYDIFVEGDDCQREIVGGSMESGSLYLSETLCMINRGAGEKSYFIDNMIYYEEHELYRFYSKNIVLELDVNMKTLTLDKDGNGTIFRINSTIKTNW